MKSDGTNIEGKNAILAYLREYFEIKYSADQLKDSDTDILIESVTKRLTEEQRCRQAGPFTLCELEMVRKKMKKGKSPGNDGLTTEFYTQTWSFIKNDLLAVFNEMQTTNKLSLSMTQGIITLIYKNKGSREDIKNYRPITLLNTDYKLMTGMITSRILPILTSLIDTDQACTIPGRFMEDQLICLQDIYGHIAESGGKTMVIALDLESAFCKINHLYLYKLLERLNFGYKMRDMIRTICSNMYSAIIVNGAKTNYFKLHRSIRQGDCASMALFVIAIEPLANIIRNDRSIMPVIIPNQAPKKISQYCDDTTVLTTRVSSFAAVKKQVQTFERGAGAKLNADKTEVLLIGKWSANEINKIPQQNLKKNIKILGVWFGPDARQLNRERIIKKVVEVIAFWDTIPLSFEGKRLIINTKIMPVLYHIIRITGMDDALEKALQSRIRKFIWHPRKMFLIAYETLQNSKEKAGLEMPNLKVINKAILTERICKFLKQDRPWSGQFIYRMGISLREIRIDLISTKYAHTLKTTATSEIIINTYRELRNQVTEWPKENFSTLTVKLHKNNVYKKEANRDYTNTWKLINSFITDRKSRDITYLLAHNSLPVAHVLTKRGLNIDVKCRFCNQEDETREHLFFKCDFVKQSLKILERMIGRTLSEEEIFYHEGRIKMRKKDHMNIAAFKQTVWQVRAKLYHGEIKQHEIRDTLSQILRLKSTK